MQRLYAGPTALDPRDAAPSDWHRGTASALVGRMTQRAALVCTIVVLFGGHALAQPAPAPAADTFDQDLQTLYVAGGLTSDQAAARAHTASPTVRRRSAEIEAAIAQTESAELQRVPQLKALASYTRLSYIAPFEIAIPGIPAIAIPFLQNSYDSQATLSIPLSDYVVRYPKLIDAARMNEASARISKQNAEVSAGQDARLDYYEWVRARLQVLIARRQLAQVQATLGQEKALLDVQRVSRADYLRIESQAAEAQQTLDQLQYLAELREEQLRIAIGAADGEQLAVGEDIRIELAAPARTGLDDLMKRASERRLDIRGIDVGIIAKDKQREADKTTAYPHFSAFGTVEDARPNPRIFPQSDVFKATWLAGIQLTWQLSDTLQARATEHREMAESNELRADRENALNGAKIEVLSAQQAVQLAVLALTTSQKGLAAAEESYRVRNELLAAQRATAVELVDAQTDLTRARIAALNARVDLRVALAQLAHAIGDDTGSR